MLRRLLACTMVLSLAGLLLAADPPKPARTDLKTPKAPSPQDASKNELHGVDTTKSLPNLLVNGDFELGDATPKGWQAVDGLCSYWVTDPDPAHGKVLKFDTDVYQSQAYGWWPKISRGLAVAKDAPKKTPTVGDKYDTIAGNDGVWFWSDPVPCKPGATYWLTLDVKGPALLVWLMGYPDKPDTAWGADNGAFQDVLKESITGKPIEKGRDFEPFIHAYIWKGQLTVGGSDSWRTYSRRKLPFRPTANTPTVKWLRVMLYPFWPPGEYRIDNVRLVEIDDTQPQPAK